MHTHHRRLKVFVLLSALAACTDTAGNKDARPVDSTSGEMAAADLRPGDGTGDRPGCLGDKPIKQDTHMDLAAADAPGDVVLADAPLVDVPLVDAPLADAPVDSAPDTALPDGPAKDLSGSTCPAEMVLVNSTFCMDKYEASRPDATKTSEGVKTTLAVSKKGVVPWQMSAFAMPPANLVEARAACKAAGKYLCSLSQWITGCQGPKKTAYGYGSAYKPEICNGIEKYCYCSTGTCKGITPCPFLNCHYTCGSDFKVDPTGANKGCETSWGAFDVNGNVWELADSTDGLQHFRGGAFNCGDSKAYHRCDHDGTWGPSARGFRCCKKP